MSITKVPKHAKRVFKGVIFDVHQWQQKMYDGKTKTFEIIKRQDTVIVIPTIGNKIVLEKQKQPAMKWFYSVPSGRMDKEGETPRQTALRELLEETGLRPKKIRLWKKFQRTGKVIHNIYIFIANDCEKVAEMNLDGGEKITIQLLTFEQFLKLSDHPNFYEGGELSTIIFKARLNPKLKQEFKKAIFG